MSKKVLVSKKWEGEGAILKRITGLKSINFKSRPSKYNTNVKVYDDESAVFESDFTRNVLPGAVTVLAPFYNELKGTYWAESDGLLSELVNELKLEHDKYHPTRAGHTIKPEEVNPTNFMDHFFNHEDLRKLKMVGGQYVFKNSPLDKFLFYCYKHDMGVIVRGGGDSRSYIIDKAIYELIIPERERMEEVLVLDQNVDSAMALAENSHERKVKIAEIMELRVSSNADPDELKLVVGRAAMDTKKVKKYGDKSPQDIFLKHSKMSNPDLDRLLMVNRGLKHRLIQQGAKGYEFNFKVLEGVYSEDDLFHYFNSKAGTDDYKSLVFKIEEYEKQYAG